MIALHEMRGTKSWRTPYSTVWESWWERFQSGRIATPGTEAVSAWAADASEYNRLDGAPAVGAVDDDTLVDVILPTGAVTYLLSGRDIAAVNAAEETPLADAVSADRSWRIVPPAIEDGYEHHVSFAGDVDRDSRSEVLVGAGQSAFLLNPADLPVLDRGDGRADGVIGLIYVAGDRDQDDYPDLTDRFPHDPAEWADSDGDEVGDNTDAFPQDSTESADFDSDGMGNNKDADDDGDGVDDAADVFPLDAAEWADSDSDGTGDNADAFPRDATETTDSDNDGVGDNADAFPLDSRETADADGDGAGDNADAFPRDAAETTDTDGDGIGNNADPDDDNDEVADDDDAYPLDRSRHIGNASFLDLQYYQGVLAYVWDATRFEDKEYVPTVLGRRAVVAVRIQHYSSAVPQAAVQVQSTDESAPAQVLQRLSSVTTLRPGQSESGRWETTWRFDMPGSLVRKDYVVSHQIDPQSRLAETDKDDNLATVRLGGMSLPRFEVKFIPIRSPFGEPDISSTDPFMKHIYDLLPIADDYHATVGETLEYDGDSWNRGAALGQLLHLWNTDAKAHEYWHGVFRYPYDGSACGQAFLDTHVAVSADVDNGCASGIYAHETGHNFNLRHVLAGCGEDSRIDYDYPYPLGGIGPRRGWLFSAGRFINPDDGYFDVMGYCQPKYISDYHYRKAVLYRWAHADNAGAPEQPGGLSTFLGRLPDVAAPVHSNRPADTRRAFSQRTSARNHSPAGDSANAEDRSIALTGSVSRLGRWSLFRASRSKRAPRPGAPNGAYRLTLLNETGAVIFQQPLALRKNSHGSDSAWAARVPAKKDARRVVILNAADAVMLDLALDSVLKR